MKIIITIGEIRDHGLWQEYCELTGTNEWAVSEGLLESDQEITLDEKQVEKLNLLEHINDGSK